MDIRFSRPIDERFAKISGLALVAATLLVLCSTLVV